MVETSSVAGVIAGMNPLEYSPSAPYTLFLFQAIFIICLCSIVHYPIKLLQQPKVIAEVIAGILLGPTVLGRIDGFTLSCFPTESIPGLTLMANIGVILFLFILGLEVDIVFLKKNLKVAVTVGLVNMAIPFGLGCAISVGFYKTYALADPDVEPVKFTTYMVFIAVAMCITALPVLARILTELNLIGDRVGTIVLAAGITNDLVGWILLALTVTLANSAKPETTVYILLLTFGWFLFLWYIVRHALHYYFKKFTNDLITGEPSHFSIMIVLLLVFVSAFYTDIIGVHAIFGAFMIGVIVPRDNGLVIKITEKLEDLVHILLIPIYFALAGLNVNLGLLNSGTDWGYTIGVICLAMVGKIFGGFISAKFNKLLWRESLSVGVLMSCKGIVEIVVLNVGLNAKIISQKVYSMFIVMALVTTFLTTPLTLWAYPISYRQKVERYLKGEINWDGTLIVDSDSSKETPKTLQEVAISDLSTINIPRAIVLLKKIDTLSSLMQFCELYFKGDSQQQVTAIHLRELGSRTSDLLEASNTEVNNEQIEYINSTSILNVFKVFSDLLHIHSNARSLLSIFKNHVFTINDQVNDPLEFLVASAKISTVFSSGIVNDDMGGENSDYALYKKLFKALKCNFGLLLTPGKKRRLLAPIIEGEADTKTLLDEGSMSFRGITVIINSDNSLTSSDMLALHTVLVLARNIPSVTIFIKSESQSIGLEDELESLFSTVQAELSVRRIKDASNFTEEILRVKPNLRADLVIVANNISKESNLLFSKDVAEVVSLCEVEDTSLLVVKAPSSEYVY